MYYEENCVPYIEDEGCCDAVLFKFRKKRRFIVITLLLILAMISILAGLYNGFTVKKYSDLAIVVGIFFPSIILVFICIYVAFICGRESFRASVLPRIHHSSSENRSHRSRDTLEHNRVNSTTRNDFQVRYQPKSGNKSLSDPFTSRNGKTLDNKTNYNTDDVIDYSEVKISRKRFRSFSNSDISKRIHKNDMLSKKPEMHKTSSRKEDGSGNSPRFRGYYDGSERKRFTRSVSDTANRNRYAKSRDDDFVWNAQALHNLRRHVINENSFNDATEGNNYEAIRKTSKILHELKNYDNSSEECDRTKKFKEYSAGGHRHKSEQHDYVNARHQEDIQKNDCCTKSEVHLYSSSVLKPPYEYKQTLHLSTFQPERNDKKDIRALSNIRDRASCSSSGDEKNGSFSNSDALEMEKNEGFENFSSERDTYRSRRAIYFPSTSSKESTRPSRKYAHEGCIYSSKENKTETTLKN